LAPTLLQLDIPGALGIGLVTIVFSFLLVDLFDNAGTLVGLAHRAGFIDKEGKVPRLRQVLVSDSGAAMLGSVLGTSTTTSYIESAAGINAGGRTGVTALVVAVLFVLALVFAPIATAIPAYATAPAILFVACIMARSLVDFEWDDVTDYVPAIVTALAMPFTFSIATGIGLGFIAYALIKIVSGRLRDATPAVLVLAAVFIVKFAIG